MDLYDHQAGRHFFSLFDPALGAACDVFVYAHLYDDTRFADGRDRKSFNAAQMDPFSGTRTCADHEHCVEVYSHSHG